MSIEEILKNHKFLKRMSKPSMILLGRDEELQLLKESLYKKRMKNTILVGPAGCGKTILVETFAQQIINDYVVLDFNLASCLAGTRYRGDLEEKIEDAISLIVDYNKSHKDMPIILFIDEIHTINSGDTDGSISMGNILKPYLSKNEVTIIGATTFNEYMQTIKQDAALKRRLSPIYIKELTNEEIIVILNEFAKGKVSKQLLQYIYQSSLKINDVSNPDTSIEILDRCMARAKISQTKINKEIIDQIIKYMHYE